MSTRWFNILFRLEVLHNFYSSGVSKDIRIKPTSATVKKIAGARHLLKYKDNSPLVIFEATDDARTPRLPITGDTKLVFTGNLTNAYFSNFTDLPAKENEEVYVYDNLGGNLLQQSPALVRPQVFAFSFTTSRVNADLEIIDRQGNVVLSESLHSSEKTFSANLKLLGADGLHRFKVTTTQGIEVDQQIYISNELAQNQPWCIIEIFQQGLAQFDYNSETVYQLEFQASHKPWHYNISLSKDYINASFAIEDKENYGSPKNHPYVKIDFVETSGAQSYQKGQTLSFTSGKKAGNQINEQLIPFYEDPKKELQLIISMNGADTVISPLPNPSSISPQQEVYLTL